MISIAIILELTFNTDKPSDFLVMIQYLLWKSFVKDILLFCYLPIGGRIYYGLFIFGQIFMFGLLRRTFLLAKDQQNMNFISGNTNENII